MRIYIIMQTEITLKCFLEVSAIMAGKVKCFSRTALPNSGTRNWGLKSAAMSPLTERAGQRIKDHFTALLHFRQE